MVMYWKQPKMTSQEIEWLKILYPVAEPAQDSLAVQAVVQGDTRTA